jgi:spore maturation protein CgeB
MIRAGYAPSVRLFEAAACGTPIVSDAWEGLDTFFTPGKEIVIARHTDDVLHALCDIPQASVEPSATARARACWPPTRPPIARGSWKSTRAN